MNYQHLFYFRTVAVLGGITPAAQKLRLTAPPLSAQIRTLEDSLGVALFDRSARGMSLTDAGHVALRYADRSRLCDRRHVTPRTASEPVTAGPIWPAPLTCVRKRARSHEGESARPLLVASMHSTLSSVVLVVVAAVSASCTPPSRELAVARGGRSELVVPALSHARVARLVPRIATTSAWEDEAERNAERVLRSIHGELLGCYARRLTTHPTAHAHLVLEVLVGDDGRPLYVATTGGALLGDDTLECMKKQVRATAFAPPRGGGTSRIRVPLSFHPDVGG